MLEFNNLNIEEKILANEFFEEIIEYFLIIREEKLNQDFLELFNKLCNERNEKK